MIFFHELIPSLSNFFNTKTIPSIVKSTFKPYSITIVALVFLISNFFSKKQKHLGKDLVELT